MLSFIASSHASPRKSSPTGLAKVRLRLRLRPRKTAPSNKPAQIAASPREQAAVLAVEAIDELVASLIASHRLYTPTRFLDWVADTVTPRVAARAKLSTTLRSAHSQGQLQSAVRQWVYDLVASEVHARYMLEKRRAEQEDAQTPAR